MKENRKLLVKALDTSVISFVKGGFGWKREWVNIWATLPYYWQY